MLGFGLHDPEKEAKHGKISSSTGEPRRSKNNLPKLKLRDVIATLKLFQPCCFPIVPPSKLSNSRRSSAAAIKSRSSSVVAYTVRTAAGRLNELKSVDEEALDVFLPVRDEIKDRLTEAIKANETGEPSVLEKNGGQDMRLTVISYKTQVVVGLNYFAKIKVNDGPLYVHARIYQPIQGEPFLTDLCFNKNMADEIEYF